MLYINIAILYINIALPLVFISMHNIIYILVLILRQKKNQSIYVK